MHLVCFTTLLGLLSRTTASLDVVVPNFPGPALEAFEQALGALGHERIHNILDGPLPDANGTTTCADWDALWASRGYTAASGFPSSVHLDTLVACDPQLRVVILDDNSSAEEWFDLALKSVFLPFKSKMARLGVWMSQTLYPSVHGYDSTIALDGIVAASGSGPSLPMESNREQVVAFYRSWHDKLDAFAASRPALTLRFNPHTDDWGILCEFLGVEHQPSTPFPRPVDEDAYAQAFMARILETTFAGLAKALVYGMIALQLLVRNPYTYKLITVCTQVWFGVLLAWMFLNTWFFAHVIHAIPFLSLRVKENASMVVLRMSIIVFFRLQPWIRVRARQDLSKYFAQMREESHGLGGVLFLNHTSLLDPILMSYMLPFDICMSTRTLAKEALFRPPVLGAVFRLVGHFPVHFKDNVSFSVDKEKQAKVTERVNAHLGTAGTLTFCPEGAVNKEDPSKLKSFRRGSFRTAAEMHLPVWGMVCVGNHEVWPPRKPIGGFPAAIDVDMVQIRSRDAWKNVGTSDEDIAKEQLALCESSEKIMQGMVDDLFTLKHRKKPVPRSAESKKSK